MISSPGALKDLFKHERRGAFAVIENQQMHTMAGHHAEPDRCKRIYELLHQRAFRTLYRAFSPREILLRGPHINAIILRQIYIAVDNVDVGGNLSMTFFTRHVVFQTITTFFFGPHFPDIFDDGNLLDTHMATIMYGLEVIVPSAIRARERLYNTFAAHLALKWEEKGDGYLYGSADFISEIVRNMKSDDFSREEIPRYMIPILWGATSNLMSICTWVMGHLLGDSRVYKSVEHEIRLATDQLTSDDILSRDFKNMVPNLNSVIEEVLRTKTQVPLMRVAQRDVILMDENREIYIRKGDFVAPDAPSLSLSSEQFDHPHSFKADRFISSTAGGALYVFGAGQHACAGKHLAMHIIRMVVILSIHSFDIDLSAASDKVLKANPISFSPWLKTANDLVINLSPRSTTCAGKNLYEDDITSLSVKPQIYRIPTKPILL
ncbi:hypothetical protein CVT25_006658 [Psilocybe cyanescens]|uniref:Cytochrome P450 n=1 Tax=Psilocybe cyanescens TaxID=93625 RepID=A0A409XTS1_PSICY|nr:hypothetical protein CVT25_006658 [Psilocybe cyanescens]